MMQINQLAPDSSPEAAAKKKAAMVDYLKTVDRKNPEELITAIGLSSQVGDWDEIKKAVDDLAATDRTKWSIITTQQLAFLAHDNCERHAAGQRHPGQGHDPRGVAIDPP